MAKFTGGDAFKIPQQPPLVAWWFSFGERLEAARRRRLLHRRPAKWWRHPVAWTTIRGKHWGKSFRSYIVTVAKDHRQNERWWKNATN